MTTEVPPSRLAAAQILVSAPQRVPVVEDFDVRLPERATVPLGLADRVEQVPGVAEATPDVTFPVSVEADGATLTADAHDWSVAALADPVLRGAAPGPGSVVLDEELADAGGLDVGDRLRISGATARDVRVAGVVDAPGAGVHLSPATVRELPPCRTARTCSPSGCATAPTWRRSPPAWSAPWATRPR